MATIAQRARRVTPRRLLQALTRTCAAVAVRIDAMAATERRGSGPPSDTVVSREHHVVRLVTRSIDRPGQHGPSWSLFADRYELVRFDLFESHAHCHANYGLLVGASMQNRSLRLHGGAGDRAAWSADELRMNCRYHLATHPIASVRRLAPTAEQVDRAARWLEHDLRMRLISETNGGDRVAPRRAEHH